ncbi:NUDIX hydrolase [Uliginosibacterium sediminicola]|uniref:GDP-mannose pyrophosphatase n=1 Tax=Uliginosibacterium sediminicola TaxID=2024550 RepID=A0ABU9Z107_9RHOO
MSETRNLEERCLSSEQIFEGGLLKAWRDRIELPDGSQSVREYVRHPGASVVIAETQPGVLLFERQFRYPVGQVFIEFPAGKRDQGEDFLACAQRELREETGYRAESWQHLGTMHPCIGYSDERIDIFLARELSYVGQHLDQGEFLEIFEMSLAEAEQAVLDGRITDAKTVTCLFWAAKYLA